MIGLISRSLLIRLSLLVSGLALLAPTEALAETSDSGGAAVGILVLRNGNVLSGRIIRLKDHYQVQLPKGQLQVPVDQVEQFCHTLDEAYQWRRRMRVGSMADSHLELAQWCVRHRLYEQAAEELVEARKIDPGHRKLAVLELRLKHAQKNSGPKKSAANKVATELPNGPTSVRPVPQRARAMFVRQIQPMLVKSCAAAGCHQTGSSRQLQLNRHAIEGAGHPQATLGNLTSTLAQVDWQAPSSSALFEHARAAHGDLGESTSRPLQLHQLQMLRVWLEVLAAPNQPNRLASEQVGPAAGIRLPKVGMKIPTSAQPSQGVRTASAVIDDPIDDPFDPEVFNRRYQQDSPPESEPARSDEQTDQAPQEQPSTPQ